jgi:ketosteroid isomerase-like protein
VRDRDQVLEALRTGRALLSAQRFEVHEVMVVGDRAAVRVTWTAVVGAERGRLPAGTGLSAEVASFLTVRDGRIVEQETFDCYPPLAD